MGGQGQRRGDRARGEGQGRAKGNAGSTLPARPTNSWLSLTLGFIPWLPIPIAGTGKCCVWLRYHARCLF